jgi:hypothetical protein
MSTAELHSRFEPHVHDRHELHAVLEQRPASSVVVELVYPKFIEAGSVLA